MPLDNYEYNELLKDLCSVEQDRSLPRYDKVASYERPNYQPVDPTASVSRIRPTVPSDIDLMVDKMCGPDISQQYAAQQETALVVDVMTRANDASLAGKTAEARDILAKGALDVLDQRKRLRKDVAPAIPTEVGVLPNARPRGSGVGPTTRQDPKKKQRRADLQQLVDEYVGTVYDKESLQSLLDAMEAYMDNVAS